jgi:hypothetical protein
MTERPGKSTVRKVVETFPTLFFALILYAIIAVISPSSLGVKLPTAAQSEMGAEGESAPASEVGIVAETAPVAVSADGPEALFSLTLMSGSEWGLTVGELLVTLGLILLTIEVVKSTKTSVASSLEHAYSAFVFVLYMILFLSWSKAGSATFFLLMMMSLIDLITGIFVTVAGARRDFGRGDEAI